MTRIYTCMGVVGAIALGVAAPAFADSQLAASAGLGANAAATMSLTEIAAVKFNNDTRPDDYQRVERSSGVTIASRSTGTRSAAYSQLTASAGLSADEAATMTPTEIAAVKFNDDTRPDDYQRVEHVTTVTIMSRSSGAASQAFAQLIASAGLTPAEADGMSLTEIAAYKFDRDTPHD